ncbi:hypothetical protein JXM83_02130 [Candidatus Woesearchaeota archaeon]|nr:hypothetical protein [Candidatus Woesearchaeota archaeon]
MTLCIKKVKSLDDFVYNLGKYGTNVIIAKPIIKSTQYFESIPQERSIITQNEAFVDTFLFKLYAKLGNGKRIQYGEEYKTTFSTSEDFSGVYKQTTKELSNHINEVFAQINKELPHIKTLIID